MCFSPEASFIASGVLIGAGILCLHKNSSSRVLPFAAMPFLFGMHQLGEGYMRLCLGGDCSFGSIELRKYYFFFFSQVLRPTWIPLSIYLLERKLGEKRWLKILLIIGIFVSVYLGVCLYLFGGNVFIEEHHLRYILDFPSALRSLVSVFYVLAILLPPFLSSTVRIKKLGVVLALSFLLSLIFYRHYLISVRCFFASLISVGVYFIVREEETFAT